MFLFVARVSLKSSGFHSEVLRDVECALLLSHCVLSEISLLLDCIVSQPGERF